jgi:HAD superfamily hydrolase (TIGR01509 family)
MAERISAPSIGAVIFDLDGVLADTAELWHQAESELRRRHGFDPGQRSPTDTSGLSMMDTIRDLLPGMSHDEHLAAQAVLMEIAEGLIPPQVRPMPGAIPFLRLVASDVPVGVASNTPRALLGPILERIGAAPLVEVSVSADEVGMPKPAPDVYIRACRLLGVRPEDALVFEDSLTGVQASHTAGCRTIHVTSESRARAPGSDGQVETLVMARARWSRTRAGEDRGD